MQSFALCAMIGAHNDREYLNTIAITTAKMNIDAARSIVNMCNAIQPGTWMATNNSDVNTVAIQKPSRSVNFCSMKPRYGISSMNPTKKEVPSTLFHVSACIDR